mmetsp:Transcript_55247/g.123492  ORF Transcript_55247/g.123492 Transcript_55247/m.123492 type:complete len:247 (+) Transcript_55247:38-778(+)
MASPRARWTGGEAVRHDSSNSSPVITSRPYLALSCRILAGDGAGGSLAAASAAAARLVAWVGATFSASQQAMCSSALPLTPASSATVAGDGEGRPFGVREVRVVVALFRWYSSELVPAFASSWGGSGAIVTAILRSPQGSIDSRPEPNDGRTIGAPLVPLVALPVCFDGALAGLAGETGAPRRWNVAHRRERKCGITFCSPYPSLPTKAVTSRRMSPKARGGRRSRAGRAPRKPACSSTTPSSPMS